MSVFSIVHVNQEVAPCMCKHLQDLGITSGSCTLAVECIFSLPVRCTPACTQRAGRQASGGYPFWVSSAYFAVRLSPFYSINFISRDEAPLLHLRRRWLFPGRPPLRFPGLLGRSCCAARSSFFNPSAVAAGCMGFPISSMDGSMDLSGMARLI